MTPKTWTKPCGSTFRREPRSRYTKPQADDSTARSAMYDVLRAAVADITDDEAETDLAELCAAMSDDDIDELASLAEAMHAEDGDE